MATLRISHSGIELIGTTNWILIEAFQFLEGIFNKFQTAWSLNTDWPSFQKCGKLPTLTDQWLEQSHCPPKKVLSKTAPEKMLKSKKSGWTTCYILYVKIICIFELYYIYIYMYIKNILGVTFLPAKGLILVLQKWLMYFPVTRRWLENAPEMDGWMSSQKWWNWRQEIARQQLLTRNLPQQHPWKHHRSSKQNTHTHTKKYKTWLVTQNWEVTYATKGCYLWHKKDSEKRCHKAPYQGRWGCFSKKRWNVFKQPFVPSHML